MDESTGEVTLGVSILSGTPSENIAVRVITMERSAEGRHHAQLIEHG